VSHTIHILAGPTAVGKTALALAWAEANDAEIVNADALLFYQGMDIGTAKPSHEERARVPHHLIDLCPVRASFSIKEYVSEAQRVMTDIFARGKRALVVGGSGFYLKSFFAPVADDLEPDPVVREGIAHLEAQAGLPGLLAELDRLNPAGTGRLDRQNPRRVARALERCRVSGQSLLELEAAFAAAPSPFAAHPKRTALLLRPNEELHPRVAARTRSMLEAGLVDEVRRLRAEGLEQNPTAARSIGYRETLAWLDAPATDQEALAEAINQSTRQLIAKQRKWFRNQLTPDQVIDPADNALTRLSDCFR